MLREMFNNPVFPSKSYHISSSQKKNFHLSDIIRPHGIAMRLIPKFMSYNAIEYADPSTYNYSL